MTTAQRPQIPADRAERDELIDKYRWAGRIRAISALVLFGFLLALEYAAGAAYLTTPLIALLLIEVIANQPHPFILRRVNVYRFQFYQMLTDIIVITWISYYMGGLEAPVVTIAYYAIILWAGVVSGLAAVFFAVLASSIFFAGIVILKQCGLLPPLAHATGNTIPDAETFSLLFGNIAFFFAFGYFSAHSSRIVKRLELKRQEESLRSIHKLMATGYLVGGIVHDVLNYLAAIKGNIQVLLLDADRRSDLAKRLGTIEELGEKSAELLRRLARFSKPLDRHEPTDINRAVEEALELTRPVVRYATIAVHKVLGRDIPPVMANRDQLQEVFVALILNALDAVIGVPGGGTLTIRTDYRPADASVRVLFVDNGRGIGRNDLARIGEPFFSTKHAAGGIGLGIATSHDIITRHGGTIDVGSTASRGTAFTIRLPALPVRLDGPDAAVGERR